MLFAGVDTADEVELVEDEAGEGGGPISWALKTSGPWTDSSLGWVDDG